MSETQRKVMSCPGQSYPMGHNRPTSWLGTRKRLVDQNCMLAGIVILLVHFVNVYTAMSLNRLFSDTIYQLMWDKKKSEKFINVCPSIPVCTKVAEGTTFRCKNEHKKLKQTALTTNNNETKNIQVKALLMLCLC